MYDLSLFIFRRDLRLKDNTALIEALNQSKKVIPCFIFDPHQIGSSNDYRSMNAIQFMVNSLKDVHEQLKKRGAKLYLFYGDAPKIVTKIIKEKKIDAVFVNQDYTPFSLKRDKEIEKICNKHDVAFESYHDELLNEPNAIKTGSGTPYAVFTPFFKKSRTIKVNEPIANKKKNYFAGTIATAENQSVYKKIVKKENKEILLQGGTKEALSMLKKLKQFKDYNKKHDFPAIATTHLSAHLKFGTVSIRETFHAIKKALGAGHPLLRQLYWRDFWTYVAYHSPFVYGQAYHKKYNKLWWSKSKKDFEKWCEGKTGFPIVDAGMRQLNTIGFMHNRVRMIVASFLTKDLHINWLWGEKYFAQQLLDYDPAVNNGNWQWSASTGCDGQPYFRIFNPWLQQKKFDPDADYIKQWIPELKNTDPKIIHNWFKETSPTIKNYPRPMVDHKKESALAKKLYKEV